MNENSQIRKIVIHASKEDYAALEMRAKDFDVTSERMQLVLNSAEAPSAETLILVGSLYGIARCICAYLLSRKKRFEVVRPDMHLILENFTADEVEHLLKSGGYFYIKDGGVPKDKETKTELCDNEQLSP